MAEPINLHDRRDKLKGHFPAVDTTRETAVRPDQVGEPGPDSALFALGRLPVRTPLVGRTNELSFLKDQFEAVAAGGEGRLLFVSGEPGVGKTRLVQELGSYVRQRGGVFLDGCYLRDGTAPYGPWVDTLRAALRGLRREDLVQAVGPYGAELAQIFPELTEELGPFAPTPTLPPEDRRRQLYDGISGLVSHLAQRAPLVLLLDDLQWAPGLSLLAHLARHLGQSRALIVGAYREQEFKEQPALVREWADLNRARLSIQIRLTSLTEEETGRLVAHYLGEGPATELREPVYRITRGNAFFIEEVLRSLAEQGIARPSASGWEVLDSARISLPESITLAIEERVVRLGQTAREVLLQAAVLGQEFGFPTLQAVTGLPEEHLAAEVERAVAARLLVDRSTPGEERYAFIDDQVQEVLYSSIPAPRRRRYHRRAGQALEALYADRLEAHVEELARHFSAGNDPEKAAD